MSVELITVIAITLFVVSAFIVLFVTNARVDVKTVLDNSHNKTQSQKDAEDYYYWCYILNGCGVFNPSKP